MSQKLLIKIRKEMHNDGFSEYDFFGKVTKESKEIWESEFQKRLEGSK